MIPSTTDGRCVAGNFVKATVAFLLLLTLVACGGGGSSLTTAMPNVASEGDGGGGDSPINTVPAATNGLPIARLTAYDPRPTALARAGGDSDVGSTNPQDIAITGRQYEDSEGDPQVFVQQLEYAHLGVWVDGNAPAVGESDHDYDYAFLDPFTVDPPQLGDFDDFDINNPGLGRYPYGVYVLETDATYRGLNFFPDGRVTMNFISREFSGDIRTRTSTSSFRDDFGGVVDVVDERLRRNSGFVVFNLSGTVTDNGFTASGFRIGSSGFFADLNGVTATSLVGRFHDADDYDPTVSFPINLSGVLETSIGGGADELKMGILGALQQP